MAIRKNHLLFCLMLFVTIQASASEVEKSEKFKKTKSGLLYRTVKVNKDGKTAVNGDILYCYLRMYVQSPGSVTDSLIFDAADYPDFPPATKFIQLTPPNFKGDLVEGLQMMHVGDSSIFKLSADSFFLVGNQMATLPPGIKSGSQLIFHIGVSDIQTEAETMSRIKAHQAKLEEELDALNAVAKENEQNLQAIYLEENNLKEKPLPSGLIFIETSPGNGEMPQKGQKVSVHYIGYLLSGEKFDSSIDRSEPFTFTLGAGEVIPGWDEGVALMKPGGKATLIIPSSLAYGESGAGDVIPPYSTLRFEITFLNIEK